MAVGNLLRSCERCFEGKRLRWQVLAKIRKTSGLSQQEVAASLKISTAYLCDVERGRREVPRNVETLYRKLAGLPL